MQSQVRTIDATPYKRINKCTNVVNINHMFYGLLSENESTAVTHAPSPSEKFSSAAVDNYFRRPSRLKSVFVHSPPTDSSFWCGARGIGRRAVRNIPKGHVASPLKNRSKAIIYRLCVRSFCGFRCVRFAAAPCS